MERELRIGGVVVFIDPHRMEQMALVTAIHGDPLGRQARPRRKAVEECSEEELKRMDVDSNKIYAYERGEDGNPIVDYAEPGEHWPCINLVIVSPNQDCQDPYGRQLERHTSIVHQSDSSAVGNCFRFEDEALMDQFRQPTVS
jgi:hypothetical protein